jgi:arylsulfatase/uncharacterized sulfatase
MTDRPNPQVLHRELFVFVFVLVLFLALLLPLASTAQPAESPSKDAPPNIVLILADDLGFSDFGAYGSEVSTPNIDALADRGVVFSNYHTSPMCAPSRAMLMTGESSHRAGVGNLPEFIPSSWTDKPGYLGHLAPDVVTIAQRLKPRGYDTYMTGKWHLGHDPDTLPSARGFDRTFILDATGADNWEDRSYLPGIEALWFEDGQPITLPEDYYSSRNLVDKLIEYIGDRNETDAPFFAYLAMQAVHIPVQAPREFTEKYLETYKKGWRALRKARRAAAIEKGLVPADSSIRRRSRDGDPEHGGLRGHDRSDGLPCRSTDRAPEGNGPIRQHGLHRDLGQWRRGFRPARGRVDAAVVPL